MVAAARAYDGPIVDGHAHWGAAFEAKAIVERYKRAGVVAQVVMPRYLGVLEDPPTRDEVVIDLAQTYPGEIFVLAGMQRPEFTFMNWNRPSSEARNILIEVEGRLASGAVRGIGEVLIRHWAYPGDGGRIGRHAEIDQRPNTTFMRLLSDLATRYDVPLVIHMEGYPDLVEELDRLLADFRGLKLVWAHSCGRSHPEIIRRLFDRHPRLNCDLSNMTHTGGYGSGWPRSESFTVLMEKDGVFTDDWRQLILDYPTRFYVGMDVAHKSRWTMAAGNTFERRVQRTRELLRQLPLEVARRLAHDNAVELFKLPVALQR